nr:hypothetical protein [Tanacetum cinerariifolium]
MIQQRLTLNPDVVWIIQTAFPESGLGSSSIFTPTICVENPRYKATSRALQECIWHALLSSVTLSGIPLCCCDFGGVTSPYHANKVEEQHEEDRCENLRNPRQEPTICKIGRFEVIKYSFGPAEKYIAIKEYEHDDWRRTEKDACHAY